MALFTPLRSPDMNTRTGLAPRTLPVHLMFSQFSYRYFDWFTGFLSVEEPMKSRLTE